MDNEEKREDPNPTRAARTSAQWVKKSHNFMFENGERTHRIRVPILSTTFIF